MRDDIAWQGVTRGQKRLYGADSSHGLWFAVDADGRPMLLVSTHSAAPPTRSSLPELKGIDVFSHTGDGRTAGMVGLRLRNPEHRDLFETLCVDVAEASSSAATEAGAVSMFVNRMHRWHALLRRGSNRLSKEEQKGLFGELYFLQTVSLQVLDPLFAVQTWQGPEDEPKDFAFGRIGVECKAKSASGRDHLRISSEHQLELEGLDQLYMFVLDLAPAITGDATGTSLKVLVGQLRSVLAQRDEAASAKLEQRLESLGYRHEDDYTEFRWLAQRSRLFEVVDGFPRITATSLMGGVGSVTYRVDLAQCSAWLRDLDAFRSSIVGEV